MKISRSSFLKLGDDLGVIESSLKANISQGQVGGFQVVCNESREVVGVITDSDLRKGSRKFGSEYRSKLAKDLMNKDFLYLYDDLDLESQALFLLEQLKRKEVTQPLAYHYIPILTRSKQLVSIIAFSGLQPQIEKFTTQVLVIGLGFVGLTFSMAMVSSGMEVFGVESDSEIRKQISSGKSHVYEPSLEDILKSSLGRNFHVIQSRISEYPRKSFLGKRIYVVAVGTPVFNQKTDFKQLDSAVDEIANDLKEGDLVVIRSSVPIGTTQKRIIDKIEQTSGLRCGLGFNAVYAPERTIEGNALRESLELPQLLAGATPQCEKRGADFFNQFIRTIVLMDSLEACEMGKLISNAYRDVIFAFSNEVAGLSENYQIDVNKLISDVNLGYARNNIPVPSPGVGGPCLTKDSYLLVESNRKESLILSARQLNSGIPERVASNILRKIKTFSTTKPIVVCVGLAFKGNPPTNDLRESPALQIASLLQASNVNVVAIDHEISSGVVQSLGFKSGFAGLEEEIRIICVLNNHTKNVNSVQEIIDNERVGNDLWLFDPWHVCESLYKKSKLKYISNMSFSNLLENNRK